MMPTKPISPLTATAAAVPQYDGRADEDVRRDEGDVVPARRVEPAEDPAVDLLDRLGVLLLDEGLHGGQEAHHRDAGEDQRRRAPAAGARAAERVREGDRRRG